MLQLYVCLTWIFYVSLITKLCSGWVYAQKTWLELGKHYDLAETSVFVIMIMDGIGPTLRENQKVSSKKISNDVTRTAVGL